MDSIGRAYGGGMAGGSLDPVTFIKRPQVLLRLLSLLMAIIVFGCIASGGWYQKTTTESMCLYNGSSGTCSFGTAVGVFAFLTCIAFIVLDLYFERISSVQLRKRVVIGDMAASAVFVFFYFLSFCVLTSAWNKRDNNELLKNGGYNVNPPQAAIAFSFLSIASWVGLAFFAWRRYQEGAATAFAPSYEQDFAGGYPGGGFAPSGGPDSYQEPPFTASNDSAGGMPQYQQPAY